MVQNFLEVKLFFMVRNFLGEMRYTFQETVFLGKGVDFSDIQFKKVEIDFSEAVFKVKIAAKI
jgi:hypothetical protein